MAKQDWADWLNFDNVIAEREKQIFPPTPDRKARIPVIEARSDTLPFSPTNTFTFILRLFTRCTFTCHICPLLLYPSHLEKHSLSWAFIYTFPSINTPQFTYNVPRSLA